MKAYVLTNLENARVFPGKELISPEGERYILRGWYGPCSRFHAGCVLVEKIGRRNSTTQHFFASDFGLRFRTLALCDLHGTEVEAGDSITDFRGDSYTLKGCEAPHSDASSGRVYVEETLAGFYPAVFNLQWKEL